MSSNTKLGIGVVAFLVAALFAFGWLGHELSQRDREHEHSLAYFQRECAEVHGTWDADELECRGIPADHDRPDHEPIGPMLDLPVSDPRSFKVSCGTVDGGAASDLRTPLDGGTPGVVIPAESFIVTNPNSTCIRVSGSDVTSSTGVQIGTAATCYDGPSVAIDARVLKCRSEGAAQTVEVSLGRR